MSTVTLSIFRYDINHTKVSHQQMYQVSYEPHDVLLNLLFRVQKEQDSSVCFDKNCRIGLCASCRVNVNGEQVLACSENVAQLVAKYGDTLIIKPYNSSKAVRDLIVDPQYDRLHLDNSEDKHE
ncbi:2Fe-2S iron-sulfur cluster-binding protein [Pseudoalteromonas sp. YIC-656]|uniref:2Fe-2S iron-sulfur cluster-binding protein n=1 Tax=Pseudoalteromonas pernae TaxID=3118054 RepID=UPI003242E270